MRETEQNFSYGCPKFVSPALPNYDEEIPQLNVCTFHHLPLPYYKHIFTHVYYPELSRYVAPTTVTTQVVHERDQPMYSLASHT